MMNSVTETTPATVWHDCARQSAGEFCALLRRATWLAAVYGMLIVTVTAQESPLKADNSPAPAAAKEDLSLTPAKVDVKPVARDEEIRQRLQNVLDATDWFTTPEVRVEEGVVFLRGRATSDDLKKWAGDLARNTQDVVTVANRMEVTEPSIWDWGPAWHGLMGLWREFLRSLPFFFLGLLILGFSVGAGLLAARKTRSLLRHRIQARLLRNVIAGGIGVLVFLVGTYIVLRVSGLTQLALTVVGGTGLVGLAVGIAFRDITENFLASIFLSMQRPFEMDDLVEVSGVTGYVQQLKVRSSVIRQVKRAMQSHGISMPDEAREVVFPQGIPITMHDGKPSGTPDAQVEEHPQAAGPAEEPDVVSTKAEGGLQSEAGVLDEQARHAQPLREGENLLPSPAERSSPAESGSTKISHE